MRWLIPALIALALGTCIFANKMAERPPSAFTPIVSETLVTPEPPSAPIVTPPTATPVPHKAKRVHKVKRVRPRVSPAPRQVQPAEPACHEVDALCQLFGALRFNQ